MTAKPDLQLGPRPPWFDERAWGLLNQATARPLSIKEAKTVAAELARLGARVDEATETVAGQSRELDDRAFIIGRALDENDRLRRDLNRVDSSIDAVLERVNRTDAEVARIRTAARRVVDEAVSGQDQMPSREAIDILRSELAEH